MMAIADWLQFLEQSSWAVSIRQSIWLYPFLEIMHIIGIVLLVGSAFLFDLRLLGFSKQLPIASLERHLWWWAIRASVLVIPSGLLLFITNASTLGYDPVFLTKMILLLTALCNALLFHRLVSQSIRHSKIVPPAAKAMAILSLLLWIAIIACGRLLAY